MQVFNGRWKYLLVLAVLVLAGFCVYFSYAFRASEDVLVRETAFEKQQDIALLAEVIDQIAEMDRDIRGYYGYEAVLTHAVQFIESNYHLTYAQLFDANLTPLIQTHPGAGGGQKHDPLEYPEFIYAVTHNESGSLTYPYTTPEAGTRDVYLTFRWVPTDINHTSRYLIAVGISKYTVSTKLDNLVVYGAIALIVVAAVFILGSSVLVIKLGHIYDMREGDKWRNRR